MCTQQKHIFNRYTGKFVLVRCGRCEACQQEKANARTRRIKNHQPKDCVCLFLTLTYSNEAIPYVLHGDLLSDQDVVPVYRRSYYRKMKGGRIVKVHDEHSVDVIENPNKDHCFNYLPEVRKARGTMGIIYYPDVQRFMKRLRINLKRQLNYEDHISYFAVGEYGPRTYRPHFHMLLYCKSYIAQAIRPVIVESWPYGDMSRANRRIQIARDAASYVSSYVNCSSSLPKILQTHYVRQVHAASKDFGAGLQCFSLPALLSAADRQDFTYPVQTVKDGTPVVVPVPIPAYIVNRFFPRFKGDFGINNDSLLQFLRHPAKVREFTRDTECRYTDEEYHRFVVRLRNCMDKYIAITGKTEYDYAIDYVRCWQARKATILRSSYEGIVDFSDFYENIGTYFDETSRFYNPDVAPTLNRFHQYQFNYNERRDIVQRDIKLRKLFYEKDKTKKINGLALSKMYDDF